MAIKLKLELKNLNSPDEFQKLIQNIGMLDQSKEYTVYISDKKTTRSTDLNAYYWGLVLKIISDYTGHLEDELHEMFKVKYNLRTKFTENEIVEYSESTAELITSEFLRYLGKIIVWASTFLGCYIPKPNEIPDEVYIKYIDR